MFSNVSAAELRPLPPRPDLKFERERAVRIATDSNGKLSIGDAELLVAREYGFASWEKLVRYFTTWELHSRKPATGLHRALRDPNSSVRQLLAEFKNRSLMPVQPPDIIGTGAAISAYVPRFYGLRDEEIFSSTLSEADAQLVAARRLGYNSWTELKHAADAYVPSPPPTPEQRAEVQKRSGPYTFASFTRGDNDRERIVNLFTDDRHLFDLKRANEVGDGHTWRFILLALAELDDRHQLLNWIRSLGVDVQTPLNNVLLGYILPFVHETKLTRLALEFGADADWIPWNGMSVLEHALVRHHNGESVDLIAARAKPPRKSFWISAGLGDVATMNSFFEANGDLSKAAHLDRPDFFALGTVELSGIARPDASEVHVMWEALIVAVMNGRLNTVEALFDRGLPPDYSPVWMNALHFCVNHNFEAVAKLLLARGASPDFKAWPDQQSPRDMAKWLSEHSPTNAAAQLVMSYNSR